RRQAYPELAPLPHARAFHLDRAAMQLGEPTHEREPDAETPARTIERLLSLDEEIEDPRQQIRLDALPVVADAKLRPGGAVTLDGDLDLSAVRRVLECVLDEVRDDLLETYGIGVD